MNERHQCYAQREQVTDLHCDVFRAPARDLRNETTLFVVLVFLENQ